MVSYKCQIQVGLGGGGKRGFTIVFVLLETPSPLGHFYRVRGPCFSFFDEVIFAQKCITERLGGGKNKAMSFQIKMMMPRQQYSGGLEERVGTNGCKRI